MEEEGSMSAKHNFERITLASLVADDGAGQAMLHSLTVEEQERLTLLQQLLATAEQPNYGKRQQAVAQKLGISDRSVRRLLRKLREAIP